MIDEVMFEIREMTGQEYRNHYAGEQVETSTEVPVVAHAGPRHRPGSRRPAATASSSAPPADVPTSPTCAADPATAGALPD